MTGDSWYWVRDSATVVDPQQVADAGVMTSLAADGAQGAALALCFMGPNVSWDWAWDQQGPPATGLLEQKEALEAQIAQVRDRSQQAVSSLAVDLAEHARWLSMAALIYAAAEADAMGFAEACQRVSALPCGLGASNPLFGLVGSLPSYVRSMQAGGQLEGGSMSRPTSGMHAQHQLRALADSIFASPDGTAAPSMQAVSGMVGTWWLWAGRLVWGESSGVVAAGPGGSLWGRPHGEGPVPFISLKASDLPSNSPVGAALKRVAAAGPGEPMCMPSPLPPKTASELLQRLPDVPDAAGVGEVQILRHRRPDGSHSWSVAIRGTREWLPGTANPQDMLSNFQEMAGQMSDQRVAVLAAMNLAGIGPADPVEFVGHSQGGAVALSLAASKEVSERFCVVSVLTAGAPSAAVPGLDVPVLALENTADVVPSLDGRAADAKGKHLAIYFDDQELAPGSMYGGHLGSAHGLETYVAAAHRLHGSIGADAALQGFKEWEQNRVRSLGLDQEGTVTESLVYTSARTRGNVSVDVP